jgi:serine/threonine-protein kinase
VKPANLFLCRGRSEPDTIKVLDFGLVKDSSNDNPDLSRGDGILGTPLYMPPEALTAESIDPRSDLYSLGAVAYFLLTGTPVFSAPSAVAVFAHHLHSVPDPLGDRLGAPVPSDLEAIVLSCLAKAKDDRPQSARVLRDSLAACADANGWGAEVAETWWNTFGAAVDARRRQATGEGSAGKTVQIALSRAPA